MEAEAQPHMRNRIGSLRMRIDLVLNLQLNMKAVRSVTKY